MGLRRSEHQHILKGEFFEWAYLKKVLW